MRGDANTGSATAATDGDEDDVEIGLIFQHFKGLGADACDEQGFVAGMDIAIAVRARQFFAVQLGFVVGRAMLDDLGAHTFHGGNLARIGFFGDDDDGFNAEKTRGIGDGLSMIAGRGRDDAAFALLSTELRNKVDAATHLEGPYWLVVLVFYK